MAAIRAAQLGAQVTVIEEDKVGGTCLHRGCIPTKSWVASVQVYEKIQKAGEYGIVLEGEARWDFPKLLERTRSVVDLQHRGIRNLFKSWGVELLEGRGRLIDPKAVEVALKEGGTMRVETDQVILATGSRPALLPLFPFDGQTVLTSDDALVLDRIPQSLLIVGAGVSGCEFACIFRLLGTKVRMVEVLPRCLSTEDEEISAVLEREFKKVGIELLCNQSIESMQRTRDGRVVARLSDGQEIRADRALVTIGRTFNTKDLGLEAVGVVTQHVHLEDVRPAVPVHVRHVHRHPGVARRADGVPGGEAEAAVAVVEPVFVGVLEVVDDVEVGGAVAVQVGEHRREPEGFGRRRQHAPLLVHEARVGGDRFADEAAGALVAVEEVARR